MRNTFNYLPTAIAIHKNYSIKIFLYAKLIRKFLNETLPKSHRDLLSHSIKKSYLGMHTYIFRKKKRINLAFCVMVQR